jgi:hypothetical protein
MIDFTSLDSVLLDSTRLYFELELDLDRRSCYKTDAMATFVTAPLLSSPLLLGLWLCNGMMMVR